MTKRTMLGFAAEGIAAKFLEERGYEVLDRNYRKPWGELDVVARKGDLLAFVEVKASATYVANFDAELRANPVKLHKVVRTARTWLADHRCSSEQEWQVDVVSVTFDRGAGTARIKHFKNVDVA